MSECLRNAVGFITKRLLFDETLGRSKAKASAIITLANSFRNGRRSVLLLISSIPKSYRMFYVVWMRLLKASSVV